MDPENYREARGADPEDTTIPQPDQQEEMQENPELDNFQRLVLMTETVNKLQRQMNAGRQTRRADPMHPSTVSDNEEEEPVPVNTALLSGLPPPVSLPAVLPTAGAPGTTNTGMANADLGQSGVTDGAAAGLEPLRWMKTQ